MELTRILALPCSPSSLLVLRDHPTSNPKQLPSHPLALALNVDVCLQEGKQHLTSSKGPLSFLNHHIRDLLQLNSQILSADTILLITCINLING